MKRHVPGLVTHTCSLSAWKKSESEGQPGLHAGLFYLKTKPINQPNKQTEDMGTSHSERCSYEQDVHHMILAILNS